MSEMSSNKMFFMFKNNKKIRQNLVKSQKVIKRNWEEDSMF